MTPITINTDKPCRNGHLADRRVDVLKSEGGVIVPFGGYGHLWDDFWTEGDFEEVLSAITLAVQRVRRVNSVWAGRFRDAVRRAMQDEHLGLRITDDGVVHLAVDEDFVVTERATLMHLEDPRLKTTRDAYESAFKFMDSHPPDTLQAVKAVFEAVEVLATQLVPAKNLHNKLCTNQLKALCVPALTSDPSEVSVLEKMFDGMAEWVDGIHFYRHRKWHTPAPSMETAVFVITSGSAYLRLLGRVAVQVLPSS
jgi:hypothetical protein